MMGQPTSPNENGKSNFEKGTTKNRTSFPRGMPLTMSKPVVERNCPGQQIFPGEEGAIFGDSLMLKE